MLMISAAGISQVRQRGMNSTHHVTLCSQELRTSLSKHENNRTSNFFNVYQGCQSSSHKKPKILDEKVSIGTLPEYKIKGIPLSSLTSSFAVTPFSYQSYYKHRPTTCIAISIYCRISLPVHSLKSLHDQRVAIEMKFQNAKCQQKIFQTLAKCSAHIFASGVRCRSNWFGTQWPRNSEALYKVITMYLKLHGNVAKVHNTHTNLLRTSKAFRKLPVGVLPGSWNYNEKVTGDWKTFQC